MRLYCSRCNPPLEFKSLLVDRDKAIMEVSTKLTQHIVISHKTEHINLATNISTIMQSLTWYLVMVDFAFIPKDEDYLIGQIDKYQDKLVELLQLSKEETEIDPEEKVEDKSCEGINSNTDKIQTEQPNQQQTP